MALIYDAAATAAITEIEMNALQHDILLALLHPRVSWTRRLITIRNFCLFFFSNPNSKSARLRLERAKFLTIFVRDKLICAANPTKLFPARFWHSRTFQHGSMN